MPSDLHIPAPAHIHTNTPRKKESENPKEIRTTGSLELADQMIQNNPVEGKQKAKVTKSLGNTPRPGYLTRRNKCMPLKTRSVNIHNIFIINKIQSPSNVLHLRNKESKQHAKEYYSALKRTAQHWGKGDYGMHDA